MEKEGLVKKQQWQKSSEYTKSHHRNEEVHWCSLSYVTSLQHAINSM